MLWKNRALTIQYNDQMTALSRKESSSLLGEEALGLAAIHEVNISVACRKST